MHDDHAHHHPLGGRSDAGSSPLTQQWFAAYGSASVPTAPPALVDLGTQWIPSNRCFDGPDSRMKLWRIDSSVRERQRNVTAGTVSPVTLQSLSETPPTTQSWSDRTMAYRLRVDMTGHGPRRSFLMDPGQAVEFYASSATAALLGPTGAVEVNGIGSPTASGFVIDTLLGCNIYRIEESTGVSDCVYSQLITVAIDDNPVIPIPVGAWQLTVYQADNETPPATVTAWGQYYGNPLILTGGGAWRAGSINFPANFRQSLAETILPGATHIRVASADTVREFFLAWVIRP